MMTSDFDTWFTGYVREHGMHAYALESYLRNAYEAGKLAAVSAWHA